MICRRCGAATQVTDSRPATLIGAAVATRRRRKCTRPGCTWRGTTYEVFADDSGRSMRGLTVVTGDVAAALDVIVAAHQRGGREPAALSPIPMGEADAAEPDELPTELQGDGDVSDRLGRRAGQVLGR